VDAYDSKAADWGLTHRQGWKEIATRPYLAGVFVWTGFDYHGVVGNEKCRVFGNQECRENGNINAQ
jgi:hypothetical protein